MVQSAPSGRRPRRVLHKEPVIGSLAMMVLFPVFTAGIMMGCRALFCGL